MEEKLAVKTNAIELLEKQLHNRAKKGQFGIIVLASATDPYLHIEKDYALTRQMLEVILKYRFPVHIITKSDLVIRDFDLLKQIDEQAVLPPDLRDKLNHKAFITFSFSTIDGALSRIFEPGATPPDKRLHALQAANQNGFHSGVSMMPILPYLTDSREKLEEMMTTFIRMGATYIFPASITLFGNEPSDSKTLVFNAIKKHFPELTEKYQKLFNDGFQTSYSYRNEFEKRIKELVIQHGIKTSIL